MLNLIFTLFLIKELEKSRKFKEQPAGKKINLNYIQITKIVHT